MALTPNFLMHFIQGSDITGLSVYDIWSEFNPNGTKQEFMEYLRGKSAYESWLEIEGNEGKTEEEFIASLFAIKPEDLTKVLTDAKAYTDTALANFSGAEAVVNTHNVATDAHGDIRSLVSSGDSSTLSSANTHTNTTVNTHNVATDAHNDIRLILTEISTKLNNFLNVDDTTKDQLSEVLALIEANAGTIESITNGKVNVTDIIDNLTTNVTNKPLSAAQGVVLKGLIDETNTLIGTSVTRLANI